MGGNSNEACASITKLHKYNVKHPGHSSEITAAIAIPLWHKGSFPSPSHTQLSTLMTWWLAAGLAEGERETVNRSCIRGMSGCLNGSQPFPFPYISLSAEELELLRHNYLVQKKWWRQRPPVRRLSSVCKETQLILQWSSRFKPGPNLLYCFLILFPFFDTILKTNT